MPTSDLPSTPVPMDRSWEALTRPGEATDYFPILPPLLWTGRFTVFRPACAWWLCEFSRLIYRMEFDEIGHQADGLTRDAVLRRVGWREIRFINSGGIQCALFQSLDPEVKLSAAVFRGTSGLRNWLLDLDTRPVDWTSGGQVHRGFTEALSQIWTPLEAVLAGITGPLFFTGHSLGGALALLAASLRMPDAVYAFGAPRTGDRAFGNTLDGDRVFNIINGRDIVPSLPPTLTGAEFESAGTLIHLHPGDGLRWIGKTGGLPAADDGPTLSTAFIHRRWFTPPDILSDHAPVNYRLGLERALGHKKA